MLSWSIRYESKARYIKETTYPVICAYIVTSVFLGASTSNLSVHFCACMVSSIACLSVYRCT